MDNNYENLQKELTLLKQRVSQLERYFDGNIDRVSSSINFLDDVEKHLDKNLIIVGKSNIQKKQFVKVLEKSTDQNIRCIDGESKSVTSAELSGILTGLDENDYLVLDSNVFLDDSSCERLLIDAISRNAISFKIGKGDSIRDMSLKIEKLNYIIFADSLKLLSDELLEIADVLK